MKLEDQPEIDEGEYGWCVYDGLFLGERPRLVFYDDDEHWCSHRRDESSEDHECDLTPHSDPDAWLRMSKAHCFLDNGAICYPSDRIEGCYEVQPHNTLHHVPTRIEYDYQSTRSGLIYAIATVPELDLRRLKVGYTTSLSTRMSSFRTANPTLVLLGLWNADKHAESAVHEALGGRLRASEVFDVDDLDGAFDSISAAIKRSHG